MRVFTDGKYRAALSLIGTAFGELEFSSLLDPYTLQFVRDRGIEIEPGWPNPEELPKVMDR